jgi:hypothetical protein
MNPIEGKGKRQLLYIVDKKKICKPAKKAIWLTRYIRS